MNLIVQDFEDRKILTGWVFCIEIFHKILKFHSIFFVAFASFQIKLLAKTLHIHLEIIKSCFCATSAISTFSFLSMDSQTSFLVEFRRLNIKVINAAFSISIALFSNYLFSEEKTIHVQSACGSQCLSLTTSFINWSCAVLSWSFSSSKKSRLSMNSVATVFRRFRGVSVAAPDSPDSAA